MQYSLSASGPIRFYLCLLLCYGLLITLLTPFAIRTVNARVIMSEGSSAKTFLKPQSTSKGLKSDGSVSFLQISAATAREGELLVRFRASASARDKDTITLSHGLRRKKTLAGESGVDKFELPAGESPQEAAARLNLEPAIEFAEPNFLIKQDQLSSSNGAVTPDDPRFSEQWALDNRGQNGGQFGSDIGVSSAWQISTGAQSTVIAVIDSGIDFTHPDLINNQWTNSAVGTGEDVHGWDYITDSGTVKDEQGHGTAIAGIISAQGNNGSGISGVMWRASLMSLRVLDGSGTGDIASAIEAIDYAAGHGAQIINLSWGTSGNSVAFKHAIERAIRRNVVVVCSAGNDGKDIDAAAYYPASFGSKNLISVAATDNFDQLASWSNWSARQVTIAAPGTNILTTQKGGGYWTVTGTSASAPLVSGVAGLIKTAQPSLSTAGVWKAITASARQSASLTGRVSSGGVINASRSLNMSQGSLNPSPSPSPDSTGNGNDNGNGQSKNSPPPPADMIGSGKSGKEFNKTPPVVTKGAPRANLPNLDELRNLKHTQPKAKAPIESNLMCADCDPQLSLIHI